MPLTTYVAGDVLTALSLNDNFAFAADSGGLKFITGAAFTTVTSFSLPNGSFTADYDYYKLVVTVTGVTADSDFTLRLRASGSDNLTAAYASMFIGITQTGAANNGAGANVSSFNVGESDVLARYALTLDVLNPFVSGVITTIHGQYNFLNKAADANCSRSGCGYLVGVTGQFDSLSFISSVASSITGSYKVYGYENS